MKRLLYFFVTFLAGTSFAQNYTALNGPHGGQMYDLIQSGTKLIGAVPGQGIVISTDNGVTWTESNTGINTYFINDLEKDAATGKVYALTYSRLFSSSDDGATWITEASTGFVDGYKIKRNASFFFITSRYGGKVYRSVTGTTWFQVATLTDAPEIKDFDVNASGHLYICTNGKSIFKSTDSGVSFTNLDAGEGLTDTSIQSLSFNGSEIYAVGSDFPWKSTNNGTTWTAIENAGLTAGENYYDAEIECNGGTVFIFQENKYWKSTNGGTSWSEFTHPITNYWPGGYYLNTQAVLVENTSTIYVSIYEIGTFKTTDGGANWNTVNNGVDGFEHYLTGNLLFASTSNRLFFANGYPFGIYVSIDDGASFDFLTSDPHDKQIVGFKKIATDIYAFGQGINKSTDNGVSWTEINDGDVGTCSGTFFNALMNIGATAYSYTEYDCNTSTYGYYLLKSTNGAVTWTMQTITGMPVQSYTYAGNMHTDGLGNLYLYVYNYTTGINKYQVYKIDPVSLAATLVSNIPTTSNLADLESDNGNLYVLANDNKLHISIDGGANWTTKVTTSGFGNLRVINDNTFYILNSTGAILSTDGGNSWTNTGSFGNSRSAHEVVISPTNFSYILVDNAGIHKSNAQVIPPAAPTGLSVIGTGTNGVSLKFTDNSTNEDYFIVEVSEGDNLHYDSVANWTKPTQPQAFVHRLVSAFKNDDDEITALQPGTTYFFRVRAKGSGGKSAYTNEVAATTQALCTPTTPLPANRSWSASSSTGSNPVIAISGGTVFIIPTIGLGAAGAFNGTVTVNVNCLESVISSVLQGSGAIPDGNGTWDPVNNILTVKWRNGSGQATAFQETTTYTLNATDPAPGPATGLGAYVKTPTEIVVSWVNAQYAQQYQVQRSTTSGSGFVNVGSQVNYPLAYFIDNFAFSGGTTYYYRVVATSVGGGTSTSAEFSILMQTPLFEAITLPEYAFGSQGVAWIDFDDDDDQDLLVSPINAPDSSIICYENLGNGTFQAIHIPGVSDLRGGLYRTLSVGDINNDGLHDFITNTGTLVAGGEMFINKGNKEFEHTTMVPTNESNFNMYCSLVDFNNDGRLDAVYSQDHFTIPNYTLYKFFTQNSGGTFDPYEIGEIAADQSLSRGGTFADFDNDGDQDFIKSRLNIGPATEFDQLYLNNDDGTFTKATGTAFETDFNLAPRSLSWGDFDNDLDLDLFTTHNSPTLTNMLYQNNNDGTFTRLTASLPAEAKTVVSFGASWGDVDNDGDLDLAVANTAQCALYLNNGAGGFTKYSGTEYLVASDNNRTNVAFAMADYDKNGTLDIATGKSIGVTTFPTILLRNNLVPGASSNWLQIELEGTLSNKSGIGAHIIITTPDSKKQMRAITSNSGYGAGNSLIAHFGLKNQTSVTSIEVRWPSGVIQMLPSKTANQFIKIIEDGTGPGITTYLPASGAMTVSTATHVAVDLNEASTAVAGKKLYVYRTSDLTTAVFSANLTAAIKIGDHYEFTLPSKLLTNTDYTVAIDAGAFIDVWGNPSSILATGTWNFHTAPGPVATLLSPVHNATNVAANAPLEITFNVAVTAVAGKKIKVMNGVTVVLDLDVSTNGTFTGNKYTLTPATNWAYLAALQASVDPGAFIDANQNDFAGIASGTWNFTIAEAPDVAPPVITFDQSQVATTLDKGFNNIPIFVTVTDNKQVASVILHRRAIGQKDFQPTNLQPNAVAGRYDGTITAAFADDMGFEYYFEASDAATPTPNKGRLPTGNTYLKSNIRFTGSSPQNNLALPSGGTRTSWKVISIPHKLEATQIDIIFNQLGPVDKKKWRLIRYNHNPKEWQQYPTAFTTIERGKGYFINTKEGGTVTLVNALAPDDYSRDNLFTMQLTQGWNQIGNPYTVAIDWEDVRAYNSAEAIVGELKKYNNGNYTGGDGQIQVFGGGFVFVQNPTSIEISFDGQNTPGGGRKGFADLGENINDEEWALKLNLRQGELSYNLGSLGMALDASPGFDIYDDMTPPRFIDYLELSFIHPEHFAKRFTRDIVPTQSEFTWNFTVDSNLEGLAQITWNNAPLLGGEKEIYLLDIAGQRLINMGQASSYSFNPKESANFRVYFGSNLKVAPEKVHLGKAYPNPTNGNTTLAFSLPESGGLDQLVTLDIIDAMGRVVGIISRGRFSPGFHEVSWNAKEVNNGLYTYRLTVQGKQEATVNISKLVIK